MTILKTNQVEKTYGKGKDSSVKALSNVNIEIKKGELLGVMGKSGSGKTTLLNMLAGFDKPTDGTIEINHKNIETLDDDSMAEFRRKNLGFIFQDFKLMNSLTVKENIGLPLILDQKEAEVINNKVKEAMDYFGIRNLENKYPYETSGGQKQRVAISRAIVNNPTIVLADEPTGNLDTKSANEIIKLFTKLNTEKKVTILVVTHDPYVASFCNRIIFLEDGRVQNILTKESNRDQFYDLIIKQIKSNDGGDVDDI